MTLWAAAILAAAVGGYLHQPLAPRGNMALFGQAASAYAREAHVGNVVIVLLKDGEPFVEYARSIAEPVDTSTLYQMASVSKWVTAWGVMALVEQRAIDLDVPVSRYLTRWALPESEFDSDGVTVRRLLSHTAGLTDGLGYMGFAPGETPQGLVESLADTGDATEGASGEIRVGLEPGSRWKFSGGGYTVLQLLIEDITGQSFADYMQRTVLDPLGMTAASFMWEEHRLDQLATFYDANLEPAPHYRYTALAAASLYATANDGVRFIQAHLPGPDGEPVGRGVLKPATVAAMQAPEASMFGRDIWGLGPVLFVENSQGGHVIGHDGTNHPALNLSWRVNPATGNGIVVMSSGDGSLASVLGGEWVFWETGNVGFFALASDVQGMVATIVAGWIVIVAMGVFLYFFRRSGLPTRKAGR
jgi:CubicO group peptidase (beta-lactamase class C family)